MGNIYDIAILGAGASGLMCAAKVNKEFKNKKICVIDKNKNIGAKIKVSGGTKCNITNKYLSAKKYNGNEEFINDVFKNFNNHDLLKFLNINGIDPIFNEKIVKGTYFCKSSDDVINMFKKLTTKTKFYLNTEVVDVDYFDSRFIIKTTNKVIETKKLVIASGGLSYPALGATDIGFKIAQKFGHSIVKPNPALVGFTVQKDQFWFKELSGLSIDEVHIKVDDKVCKGGFLFTHKGCSGPVILSTSLYWKKGQISIDFLPTKKSYLPKRVRQAIRSIEDESFDIHNYKISPAGNFGFTKAEVTSGGVNTSEVDSKSMESNIQEHLYFLGEVLDVTGELGGYNFQWAFSSAQNINFNYKNF